MESNRAAYTCDLHTHTKMSDGNDSYLELISAAIERGLEIVAITDHDVIPCREIVVDGRALPLKEYALSQGICVIPGIEFSCNTEVEDVHIVGLGCDFSHPLFAAVEETIRESKIEAYRELCRRLTAQGIALDWQEVLTAGGTPMAEKDVQKKQIFELMAAKGYAPDWGQAKLMVKHDPSLTVKRTKPAAEDMLRLIHDTGGVAILAHPYLIEEPVLDGAGELSRAAYIERLIAAGLDGIEAAYTYDKTSYKGKLSPEEIEAQVRADYEGRLSIISGGSDYHNDGKKGVANPRQLGEKGVSAAYVRQHPLLGKLVY